ncbi:protein of unknown function [Aminobacter niigataensis]|nr:protein of unknown function [Aminobacter niigataensis]
MEGACAKGPDLHASARLLRYSVEAARRSAAAAIRLFGAVTATHRTRSSQNW